jgi:hypothetical protein
MLSAQYFSNKDTSIELSQPLFEPYLTQKLNNQSKVLKLISPFLWNVYDC